MRIMDMFRSAPAAPAVISATPPAANPTGAAPEGSTPAIVVDPNAPKLGADGKPVPAAEPSSPLADFAKMWDTPLDASGKPVVPTDPVLSILPNLKVDPKTMAAAAAKINFASAMNPEKVALALKGDVNAFNEVVNSVAQQGFAANSTTTANIVEAALRNMLPKLLNEAVPGIVKQHSVSESVAASVPIFNDPAVKPLMMMFESQFRLQNPTANATQVTAAAQKYVAGFAKAVTDSIAATAAATPEGRRAARSAPQEQDFSDFLDGGLQ